MTETQTASASSASSSPRRVLVTGGAGFIGSHLADAFVARGDRVTVLDDLSTGRREQVPEAAQLVVADIRSAEAAELVADGGFDLLVHQAAQMSVRRSVEDPAFDADVNVRGSLVLLEAALRGGVGRVLFASTGGAIYGEQERFPADEAHPARPVSPYGVAKLAVERYLAYYAVQHGLESVALRYANVYGERQRPDGEAGVVAIFLGRLLDGDVAVINGDGLQTRDYVHVSDVVRANLAAAEGPFGRPPGRAADEPSGARGEIAGAPFRVYNVGTGRETTVVELHRLLAAALGVDRDPRHGPGKPGEQRRSSVDPGRARARFDLPEPLDLAAGLGRTADWFRRRHAAAG